MLRLSVVLLISANIAQSADLKDYAGTWAVRLGNRNLFVLTLTPKGDTLQGTFDRPAEFSSNNSLFANMRGGVRHDTVVRSRLADGVLHLTTRNANDAKDEDTYTMALKGNRADLAFDDVPAGMVIQPFVLERAPAGAAVATDWEPNRAYTPGDSDTPNPEMKAIFDEDQRVRSTAHTDWAVMGRTDTERRAQTRKLMAAGALHTGKDYEEAAFVFQHGDSAPDYLLAHTLAMVAVSKGEATAIWIAAATLDRYLENIKQKQIFGTQFSSDPTSKWTQEPYDRDLVSDALRRQLGVPPQSIQAEQLKAYQAQH